MTLQIAPIQRHSPDEPPPRRGRWGRDATIGPNGRWLCYCGCGREVQPPRRTTFSQECLDAWQARNDPKTVRRLLLERDHAICAHCRMDCRPVIEQFPRRYPPTEWEMADQINHEETPWRRRSAYDNWEEGRRAIAQFQMFHAESNAELSWLADRHASSLFAAGYRSTRPFWEADHIIPVAEGGGQCGPEGYRTLCQVCHRRETAALAARRAQRRRAKLESQP